MKQILIAIITLAFVAITPLAFAADVAKIGVVDFEKVLLDKLPAVLDEQQRKNKIRNNLQSLRKGGVIYIEGKIWKMSKGK